MAKGGVFGERTLGEGELLLLRHFLDGRPLPQMLARLRRDYELSDLEGKEQDIKELHARLKTWPLLSALLITE
jgi:hypothetical protein